MSEPESKIKLVTVIAQGLGQKPAYLLIFGICVLFFIFGIGAGIYGVNNPSTSTTALVISCFVGFVVALIVGVKVVKTVEVPLPQPQGGAVAGPDVHARCITLPETGNPKIDETINAINRGVKEALEIKNKIFHEAILETCQNFLSNVADWEDGQFKAQDDQYHRILLEFYEHANSDVFSTSAPDYLSTWKASLGERIIAAHGKSRASVTRVFVFNNRSEITEDAVQEMLAQDRNSVSVRLYFDEEDPNFNFPIDVGRDFTVIDGGEAIGITASFGGANPTAIWFINDEKRKPRFLKIRDSLIRGSITFAGFNSWWQNQKRD